MKMKKRYIYLLAFFIPILIFFLMSLIAGYVPFFEEIFQVYDARHQYPGFYIEMMNKLKEGNIFFSFGAGLGFNFLGTITYYLMSPLNILAIFFKAENLTYFFLIIIYLRIGLSGLTMAIYLNNQEKAKPIWIIVFSVIFALMGFLSSYYYNFMWIDSIIMLPLILLGIDRLVKNNKCLLYIISLSLAIIFNYYIGVILCIFSVIYFIYKLLTEDHNGNIKVIKTFVISSLICGLLSAFVLIPTYYALIIGKGQIYSIDSINYFAFNKNLYSFFYKLTPASYQVGDQAYGPAMVYSSLFATALTVLFFFNKKFKLKEKIVVGVIILFFFLSFSFNLLDYGWQLFQQPIWWQSRYSFTFSTFLIIIAFKNINNMETLKVNNWSRAIIISIGTLLLIASAYFSLNDLGSSNYDSSSYFFLAFSCLLFAQMIYLIGDKSFNYYLIALVVLELSLNTYNGLEKVHFNNKSSNLKKTIIKYQETVDYLKEKDNSFYRMEFANLHTTNDGLLFNYNGINFFNSARNQKTIDFLEFKMGVDVDSGCGVKLKSYNPALLSLLNIKYLIGNVDYYEPVENIHNKEIKENKYPLSLGFMANKKIIDTNLIDGTYNQNLNKIYSNILNEEIDFIKYIDAYRYINELENVKVIKNNLTRTYQKDNLALPSYVTLNYSSDGNYLIMPDEVFKGYSTIYIDGKIYNKNVGNFIHLKKDQILKVKFEIKDISVSDDAFYFYLFDVDLYEQTLGKIDNFLEIKQNSKHLLEAKIKVDNPDEVLFTSIPYEPGMRVKVDGKVVSPIRLLDTFIGLKLTPGEHTITFDFFPNGLKEGIIISSLTLLVVIGYYINKKENL